MNHDTRVKLEQTSYDQYLYLSSQDDNFLDKELSNAIIEHDTVYVNDD